MPSSKWVDRLLGILGLIPVILCITLISLYIIPQQVILYRLSPSLYPNAELVKMNSGGGSGVTWKEEIYRTTDSIDQVIAFLESDMPGFIKGENFTDSNPVYSGYRCYDGWLLIFSVEVYEICVGVSVSPDQDNPSVTLINKSTSWIDR